MKTPEQYLTETIAFPEELSGEYTPEEKLFLEKYVGGSFTVDQDRSEEPKPSHSPEPVVEKGEERAEQMQEVISAQNEPAARAHEATSQPTVQREQDSVSRKEQLQQEQILQFVSFRVHKQKFALPVGEVQEVIRFMEPTKIPTAPRFIEGMINLRGRVTPLLRLDRLLQAGAAKEEASSFIVVCRGEGIQFGLLVHDVSTMYRVPQDEIDWNIEVHLGTGSDCLTGLFKDGDQIIGIVALDQLVHKVLDE